MDSNSTSATRHYNYMRHYDPTLGRYLAADPIGLDGGANVYAYVGGNPVTRVDSRGEFATTPSTPSYIIRALPLIGGAAAADGPAPIGDVIGGVIALGAIAADVGAAIGDAIGDAILASRQKECDDDPQCHKASKWELRQAGIYDEHDYKRENGAKPSSRFDICKCRDGSIRIAPVGQCGKTNQFWW